MNLISVSPQAKIALQVGYQHHYAFRVIADKGMISQPLYKNDWWYLPTDDSSLDAEARKRIAALKSAGLGISGYIMAQKVSYQLPAPRPVTKPQVAQPNFKPAGKTLAGVMSGVLTAVLYATGALVVLVAGVLIDPAVIVVLSDGTWLQVESWYELPE